MADEQRPRVGIIGAGRVGSSLGYALHNQGYTVGAVWSRNPAHAEELAKDINASVTTTVHDVIGLADVTLLALADDAIRPFAADMATHPLDHHGAVVHLSGAQDAAALAPLAAVGIQ
ncbi:MAG: NAD(P)-binding domain-containing protein, partial [Chloroflexota bacterium]